jgi:hypothetical protein
VPLSLLPRIVSSRGIGSGSSALRTFASRTLPSSGTLLPPHRGDIDFLVSDISSVSLTSKHFFATAAEVFGKPWPFAGRQRKLRRTLSLPTRPTSDPERRGADDEGATIAPSTIKWFPPHTCNLKVLIGRLGCHETSNARREILLH